MIVVTNTARIRIITRRLKDVFAFGLTEVGSFISVCDLTEGSFSVLGIIFI